MRQIVVGLAIGLAGLLAVVAMRLVETLDNVQRLGLLAQGAWFAERVLVTAGLFELAARATGRTRSALRVAAWSMVIPAVWNVVRSILLVEHEAEWYVEVSRWGFAAYGAGMLASAIALAVAARGFARAIGPTILMIVALLAYGWIPYVSDDLYAWLFRMHLNDVYYLANGVLVAFGLFVLAKLVNDELTPPAANAPSAARGFRMIALALRLRVVLAIVLAVIAGGLVRSAATVKLAVIGGPLLVVATMILAAIGMQRVGAAHVERMSSTRVAVAAGLVLWCGGIQLEQVGSLYDVIVDPWGDRHPVVPMAILAPLMAVAGFAILGQTIGRAIESLREAAAIRTVIFVMLSVAAVVLQANLGSAVRPAGITMLAFAGAFTILGAMLVFAGLAKLSGDALDASGSLPPARALERDLDGGR